MQSYEWDENKRRYNLKKYKIDFIDAIAIFDDPYRIELECYSKGELRFQTIGIINEVILFLVYTLRGKAKRIISVRRASKNERKAYHEA